MAGLAQNWIIHLLHRKGCARGHKCVVVGWGYLVKLIGNAHVTPIVNAVSVACAVAAGRLGVFVKPDDAAVLCAPGDGDV